MSHFVVYALLDKNVEYNETELEKLLEPYSESLNVDPYEEKCWCVGRGIHNEATSKFITDEIRNSYWEDYKKKINFEENYPHLIKYEKLGYFDEGSEIEDYNGFDRNQMEKLKSKAWNEIVLKPLHEFIDTHPDKDKANPECEDCKGTGIQTSTYNPNSKWDWWTLGGRWDGSLYNKQEELNPEGWGWTGTNLVENNSKDISVLLEEYENNPKQTHIYPYAILGSDGIWYQKGKMGWFGCSSEENYDWNDEVIKIYEKYKDCKAYVVDCHI